MLGFVPPSLHLGYQLQKSHMTVAQAGVEEQDMPFSQGVLRGGLVGPSRAVLDGVRFSQLEDPGQLPVFSDQVLAVELRYGDTVDSSHLAALMRSKVFRAVSGLMPAAAAACFRSLRVIVGKLSIAR